MILELKAFQTINGILVTEASSLGLDLSSLPREFQVEGFTYHFENYEKNETGEQVIANYISRGGRRALINI